MMTIGAPLSPQMKRFLAAKETCIDLVGQMEKVEAATSDAIFELLAIGTELRQIHSQLEAGS